MDITDDYANRDSWVGYDYRKMVLDLEHGREIEFTCNDKEFGIFRTWDGGWEFGMAKPEKMMLIRHCRDVNELISTLRIDGKTLEELFRSGKMHEKCIIHIF